MEKKRSVGLTIWGTIFTLWGGLYLAIFLINCIKGILAHGYSNLLPITSFEDFLAIFSVLGLHCVLLIAGIGILKVKPWARKVVLYVLPVFIFLVCFSYAYGETGMVGHNYKIDYPVFDKDPLRRICLHPELFIYAIIVSLFLIAPLTYYFTRPKLKEQFS